MLFFFFWKCVRTLENPFKKVRIYDFSRFHVSKKPFLSSPVFFFSIFGGMCFIPNFCIYFHLCKTLQMWLFFERLPIFQLAWVDFGSATILQAARPRTSWSFKNGWPTSPPRICNAVPASNTARRQSMHPCSRHTASLKILWNFSERSERGGNPQVSAWYWFWRIEMSERIWAFGDFSKIQFCFHFHKSDLHILFQTPPTLPSQPPANLQWDRFLQKLRTSSLPESFESRLEWPHCAEIIMRIHNQGVRGMGKRWWPGVRCGTFLGLEVQ